MQHTNIKSFEDACRILNIHPRHEVSANDALDIAAYKKLRIITKALNGDWVPTWSNYKEWKHQPYFDMNDSSVRSGFALRSILYYCRYGCSSVPSVRANWRSTPRRPSLTSTTTTS